MKIRSSYATTFKILGGLLLVAIVATFAGLADAQATEPKQDNRTQFPLQEQGQSQGQQAEAQANNAGNAQTTLVSSEQVRQAPAIAQGSVVVVGCGVGGTAGGSAPGGAGFLGITWTPAECYAFHLAASFASLGMTEAACEVLKTTKAARRAAERGAPKFDCVAQVTSILPPSAPAVAPPSREEVREIASDIAERAFKKAASK